MLEKLHGAASGERLAGARRVYGKTRPEFGIKRCHGRSVNDKLDILLIVNMACMTQSTVNWKLDKLAVTEEVRCPEKTLESGRGAANGN